MPVSNESTLDLPRDGPPRMEALPAPRATRFLLLQKGQLMCSDLTMLIAQTPAGGLKEVPVRQSAYQAGYRAYNLGLGRCPHSRGSFLSQSWWGGWWDAQRAERAAEHNQLRPAFARTSI